MELTARNIQLNIHVPDDVRFPPILAFREMLVQVFRIIIKRAINAIYRVGRDGRLDIYIDHRVEENLLEVSIVDNGLAMTPQEIAEVFEIADNELDDYEVGFGIFWARDYIQGMGGKMAVKSTLKQGTTFTLYIPIRQQTEVKELEA
jgi:sensor histidine kinase regulating citrate/malate metabolism